MWKEIIRDRSTDDTSGSDYAPVIEEHECKVGDLRLNLFRREGDATYSAHAHVDGYCLLTKTDTPDLEESKRRMAAEFLPLVAKALGDLAALVAAQQPQEAVS